LSSSPPVVATVGAVRLHRIHLTPLQSNRQFRAIAGVSMGAYGAMNIGTKHSDLFGTITLIA
jgi:S-formylglutathione hydrolase FrmB